MNCKGTCLWASDFPQEGNPHFIVIISDKADDGMVLLLPISSIKPNKYHDMACELTVDEIKDNNGKNVLTKPSYIRYDSAQEIKASLLFDKQINKIYRYKCDLSQEVLKKIQAGAQNSDEFQPYLLTKYLPFF